MRRITEFLYLMWLCKACGFINKVSLRERTLGDFPKPDEYDKFKPFSCYQCGMHTAFELHETHLVAKLYEFPRKIDHTLY